MHPWNILWVTQILILQSFRQQLQGNNWLQNSLHWKKFGKTVCFLLLDAKDNHQNQEKHIFYRSFAYSLNIPLSKTAWNTTQRRIIVMMTLKLKQQKKGTNKETRLLRFTLQYDGAFIAMKSIIVDDKKRLKVGACTNNFNLTVNYSKLMSINVSF